MTMPSAHFAAADGLHPADADLLRAVTFGRPDAIPMTYHINDSCWTHYPQEALAELMATHPRLFGGAEPPELPYRPAYLPNARADQPFTDPWGCVWQTTIDGIVGTVTHHPLADWSDFDDYAPPDPAEGDGMGGYLESAGSETGRQGRLRRASLRHGHTFQQLLDLRGYENLMFDMADGEPRLYRLIEMVEAFNLALVERDLAAGARWMGYPEDLGMQCGPLISPQHFREYIQPVYKRLMAPARQAGAVVHMHCDGDLRALADDILECGIHVLNLQDLVNGLEWTARRLKGRICIELDIDRQQVTVHGTPEDVDCLIRREVELLGSPEGGLMMIYGLYPGTPLDNARAVAEAMDRYADYYR
ncbi:MAG: hypothetical protein J7M21_06220 [Planctomycetes bacterium]|nr:hypothetical protein [Planctomycetota bacterium]